MKHREIDLLHMTIAACQISAGYINNSNNSVSVTLLPTNSKRRFKYLKDVPGGYKSKTIFCHLRQFFWKHVA